MEKFKTQAWQFDVETGEAVYVDENERMFAIRSKNTLAVRLHVNLGVNIVFATAWKRYDTTSRRSFVASLI